MATWTDINKSSAPSWATGYKSSEVIFLVSEALDFYLIGSAENDFLVTQDAIIWASLDKS